MASPPLDQLAGYAADEGACGFGIYLVFWFGTEFKIPVRKDSIEPPDNAQQLETMLINDLPPLMKDKLTVIVLDVSRPASMIAAVDSRKKDPK